MIKLKKYFTTLLNKNKLLRVMRYVLSVSPRGFTLAEMIIVIAIIGIFSSLTIINFRGNEKVREMDNQSRLLLDGIRRMQTSSLSGRIIEGQVPTAYIFEINKCLSDCSYNLKAKTALGNIDIANVLLDKSDVDLVDDSGISRGNNLIIEIIPPRSDIRISIDGNPIINNEVLISLKHIGDLLIGKKVRINGISGRMDILND